MMKGRQMLLIGQAKAKKLNNYLKIKEKKFYQTLN